MVLPLKVMLHPVRWNNTSHPASTKTGTDRRLFMIPGTWCAFLTLVGSFWSNKLTVFVVIIVAPAGCKIFLVGRCRFASVAGDSAVSSDMFAAVSTRAVESFLNGLAQPGGGVMYYSQNSV